MSADDVMFQVTQKLWHISDLIYNAHPGMKLLTSARAKSVKIVPHLACSSNSHHQVTISSALRYLCCRPENSL